jgi:hypothetical protein
MFQAMSGNIDISHARFIDRITCILNQPIVLYYLKVRQNLVLQITPLAVAVRQRPALKFPVLQIQRLPRWKISNTLCGIKMPAVFRNVKCIDLNLASCAR